MQVNDYQKAAMATLNPALDKKDVRINSVMGLCGESGEAIDIVKKWLMQGHELDKEHLVRELGDVAWYLAEAATALDIPLEAVFQGNLDKLRQRFPNGFDTGASVNRKEYKLQDLGVFHSLGALWLRVLNELENNGAETVYTDNAGECAEVKELLYLTAEVQNAALPDAIIEKHKVQAEFDWMVRNFTVQEEVPELHHENSYARWLHSAGVCK